MQRFFKLETVNRYSPLGLRFLDLVRGMSVNDGLVVTARQVGTADPRQVAVRSPFSGIYGFRTLPGLRAFEVGERPATDWCTSLPDTDQPTVKLDPEHKLSFRDWCASLSGANQPTAGGLTDIEELCGLLEAIEGQQQSANFIISLQDQMARFLPQVMLMCLPRERLVEIPLFSSPARLASAGLGAVRGELALHGTQPSKPAQWALVTATLDNHTYVGVSDARGMFTLFVPYASTLPPLATAATNTPPVDQLTWQLDIQVFYQPAKQQFVSKFEPPDMLSIMDQKAANLYGQEGGAPAPRLSYPLHFGDDLVIKTSQQSQVPSQLSQLLIEPAS